MSCLIINNINQSLFVFFVSGWKDCQYCSIVSVPLTVIKFLIIFIIVEFLIKKFFQRQDRIHTIAWCICCSQGCKQIFLIRSLYVKSESFLSQAERSIWVSRHRTMRTYYLHLGVFLKQYIILASYKDFCKLQSFWLYTSLLILT